MNSNRKIALCGVFVALAMILSYLESFIVLFNFLPGFKIGLANIVTVIAIRHLGMKNTFVVCISRVLLSGVLFGSIPMIIYSLSGGILSILVMALAMKMKMFSLIGVSILGAISHNVGQVIVAAIMVENIRIMRYLLILGIVGVLAGVFVGIVASFIDKNINFEY